MSISHSDWNVFKVAEDLHVGDKIYIMKNGRMRPVTIVRVEKDYAYGDMSDSFQKPDFRRGKDGRWETAGGSGLSTYGVAIATLREILHPEMSQLEFSELCKKSSWMQEKLKQIEDKLNKYANAEMDR